MFNIGDKVMRVGGSKGKRTVRNPRGAPVFGRVYVVSDCWDTTVGHQCMLVGFGPAPYFNGLKTGWPCAAFRKLEEIRAENALRVEFMRILSSTCVGIVLLVLLSGCELPRAGQNYNPSQQYQWVPR